ncbi:serpin-type proteinase inhibitor 5 [Vairimorpha necatrix]|uniref:Serpin-type proteinase inhibitor 5 n=1 Tax=Vairimorpha necatrix TaxID=6039 RepID=A0AAX4JGF1_9MICR
MNVSFYTQLIMLCDIGILQMYNEIRNTNKSSYFKKFGNNTDLEKGINVQDDSICIIKSFYTKFGVGECSSIEDEIFDAAIAAKEDNFKSDVFSPYGIWSMFCMILSIAEGETKKACVNILKNYEILLDDSFYVEMEKYFKSLMVEDLKGPFKNVLLYDKKLEIEDFIKKCKNLFSGVYKETFENNNNELLSRIKDIFRNLFSVLKGEKPLVLRNTSYVRAGWLNKFNPEDTTMKDFVTKNKTILVPMMKQVGVFNCLYKGGFRFIRMDFRDYTDSLCFIIALPDKDVHIPKHFQMEFKEEFKKLIKNECLAFKVNLEMPKFKIETVCNLNPFFNNFLESNLMNEDLDFGKGFSSYDSTKMNLRHKTFIDVNESGICTRESYSRSESMLKGTHSINYHCNREFVFYVFDTRKPEIENTEKIMSAVFLPILVGRYTGL